MSASFSLPTALIVLATTTTTTTIIIIQWLMLLSPQTHALQIVVPGGTGKLGNLLLPRLSQHDCCVLTRNAFLAAAPSRVTEVFGYLGESFLNRHPHVTLRDWDGGDLLDIVGQDFLGWQEDALTKADAIVHLVGGYTHQRTMATERLVREALRVNPNALHVTVNPIAGDIAAISPGMVTIKTQRIQDCEDMVRENCLCTTCLRLEAFRDEAACDAICQAIADWDLEKKK